MGGAGHPGLVASRYDHTLAGEALLEEACTMIAMLLIASPAVVLVIMAGGSIVFRRRRRQRRRRDYRLGGRMSQLVACWRGPSFPSKQSRHSTEDAKTFKRRERRKVLVVLWPCMQLSARAATRDFSFLRGTGSRQGSESVTEQKRHSEAIERVSGFHFRK